MQEYSMFERLPFRSQKEIIARDGTLLARRRYNNWLVTLYETDHAFVELWSGEEVQVYTSFKKSASAIAIYEPYINQIDVRDLRAS